MVGLRSCARFYSRLTLVERMSSAVSAKLVSDSAHGLAASLARSVTEVVLESAAAVTRTAGQ